MIIKNGKLITWEPENQILEDNQLLIQDGLIKEIGPDLEKNYPDEEIVDAGGQYVMPGNICAHTHFYGAFARGMGIPGDAPKDFPEILEKLWWPLDMALDEDGFVILHLSLLLMPSRTAPQPSSTITLHRHSLMARWM